MERKVHKTMLGAAMLFGSDTLRKRREAEPEAAEIIKILNFSLRVSRMDGIRNESIRETEVDVSQDGDVNGCRGGG